MKKKRPLPEKRPRIHTQVVLCNSHCQPIPHMVKEVCLCQCDCGNQALVCKVCLIEGLIGDCGCQKKVTQ